ncbi:MAG: hypothetical protein IPG50_37375 [Myxococcales bacterium]|nr:hypothetical protein [Myxococcales bacterium]
MAYRSSTRPGARLVRATAIALTLTGSTAWAADSAEADALLRGGVELRRAGRDAEALDAFRKAFALSPTPRARAQLALAEQALALWVESERDLKAALEAPEDPWVRQNKEALERALRVIGAKLAWITVRSNEPGAMVFVNGREEGAAGSLGELRVVAGQVVVELRLDGRPPVSRNLSVAPETKSVVAVDVVVTGVGVVAAGVGLAFGGRALSLKSERDAECAAGCSEAAVNADRDGRSAALISTFATLGGAVVAGVGVTLLLTSPKTPRGVNVGLSGRTLSVAASF